MAYGIKNWTVLSVSHRRQDGSLSPIVSASTGFVATRIGYRRNTGRGRLCKRPCLHQAQLPLTDSRAPFPQSAILHPGDALPLVGGSWHRRGSRRRGAVVYHVL